MVLYDGLNTRVINIISESRMPFAERQLNHGFSLHLEQGISEVFKKVESENTCLSDCFSDNKKKKGLVKKKRESKDFKTAYRHLQEKLIK